MQNQESYVVEQQKSQEQIIKQNQSQSNKQENSQLQIQKENSISFQKSEQQQSENSKNIQQQEYLQSYLQPQQQEISKTINSYKLQESQQQENSQSIQKQENAQSYIQPQQQEISKTQNAYNFQQQQQEQSEEEKSKSNIQPKQQEISQTILQQGNSQSFNKEQQQENSIQNEDNQKKQIEESQILSKSSMMKVEEENNQKLNEQKIKQIDNKNESTIKQYNKDANIQSQDQYKYVSLSYSEDQPKQPRKDEQYAVEQESQKQQQNQNNLIEKTVVQVPVPEYKWPNQQLQEKQQEENIQQETQIKQQQEIEQKQEFSEQEIDNKAQLYHNQMIYAPNYLEKIPEESSQQLMSEQGTIQYYNTNQNVTSKFLEQQVQEIASKDLDKEINYKNEYSQSQANLKHSELVDEEKQFEEESIKSINQQLYEEVPSDGEDLISKEQQMKNIKEVEEYMPDIQDQLLCDNQYDTEANQQQQNENSELQMKEYLEAMEGLRQQDFSDTKSINLQIELNKKVKKKIVLKLKKEEEANILIYSSDPRSLLVDDPEVVTQGAGDLPIHLIFSSNNVPGVKEFQVFVIKNEFRWARINVLVNYASKDENAENK